MERELLLLYTMAVFTGVAAVALLIQMAFLFGIFRSVRALQQRTTIFLDRWEPLAQTSRQKLEEMSTQTEEILQRLRDITETTKSQVDKADAVLTDLSRMAQRQLQRLDETAAMTFRRANETVAALQKSLMMPVRQVRGLAAAAGAVVDSLVARRRATVDQATLDEEMFI